MDELVPAGFRGRLAVRSDAAVTVPDEESESESEPWFEEDDSGAGSDRFVDRDTRAAERAAGRVRADLLIIFTEINAAESWRAVTAGWLMNSILSRPECDPDR